MKHEQHIVVRCDTIETIEIDVNGNLSLYVKQSGSPCLYIEPNESITTLVDNELHISINE